MTDEYAPKKYSPSMGGESASHWLTRLFILSVKMLYLLLPAKRSTVIGSSFEDLEDNNKKDQY